MGYDVHITRAKDWTLSEEEPISLDEWLAYVKSDPEFELTGRAEVHNSAGEGLAYESPSLAVWTSWSKHGQSESCAWFDHASGRIVVKNPTEEILGKMRRIAAALDAHVLGDEGESYDKGTPSPIERESAPSRKPWWKRFFSG